MKILHYALGFPPYRSGGLTKFSMDLMQQQVKEGHIVGMLWPGEIRLLSHQVRIKQHEDYNKIKSFEVINPTPVSYDEGIQRFTCFINEGDEKVYKEFFETYLPDVIHIHTFMGLHKNFIKVAKELKIRIVFSAHDFFPICPKVILFNEGDVCKSIKDCSKCPECNRTALSIWKTVFLQTRLYRHIKNSTLIKKLRKTHRDAYLSGEKAKVTSSKIMGSREDYLELRNYYKSLLDYVDTIHYNSALTKSVYERYLGVHTSVVIPITHGNIKDNRKEKKFLPEKLRISYLGPYGEAKGFLVLKEALDEMWKYRQDFYLNVFFKMMDKPDYIQDHGRYTYEQLEEIFENTDLLIAPSVLYETFGYTVLEALSYGVPVVVTKNVGAKDIIPDGAGVIINDICADEVKKAIENLKIDDLVRMNHIILDKVSIMTLPEMSEHIMEKCYKEKIMINDTDRLSNMGEM